MNPKEKKLVTISLLVMAVFLLIALSFAVSALSSIKAILNVESYYPDIQAMDSVALESEMTRQETLRLIIDNHHLQSPWYYVASFETLATVAIAVVGAVLTVLKYFDDREANRIFLEGQRDLDRKQEIILEVLK